MQSHLPWSGLSREAIVCSCIFTHKNVKTCMYFVHQEALAQPRRQHKQKQNRKSCYSNCIAAANFAVPIIFIATQILWKYHLPCGNFLQETKQKLKSAFPSPPHHPFFHQATHQYIKSSFRFHSSHLCNGWRWQCCVVAHFISATWQPGNNKKNSFV